MAVGTAILLGLSAASTISSIAGGNAAAKAAKKAAEYNAAVATTNAQRARLASTDAIARGDIESAIRAQDTAALVGAQRAALAAKGLDPNSGSAVQIQADATAQGKFDQLRILNNAQREALGFDNQAADFSFAAQAGQAIAKDAAKAGKINQFTSLLTGAAKFGQIFATSGIGSNPSAAANAAGFGPISSAQA